MNKNKKNIYIILVIIVLFCISVGYAFLNRVLNITGNSEVLKNTWDIHFENVKVKEGSVTSNLPVIDTTTKSTVNFNVMLNLPGDFYEFTVDVVNNGTIDAMVDSITKTPELTEEQENYINYIVEYHNGTDIASKQLVKSGRLVTLKVRVEYKKDITEFDLPETSDNLNLGFSINYTQADKGLDYQLLKYSGDVSSIKADDFVNNEIDVYYGEDLAGVLKYINDLDTSNNDTYTINILSDIDMDNVKWGQYVLNTNLVIEGNGKTIHNINASHGLVSRTGTGKSITVKDLDFLLGSIEDNGGNTLAVAGTIVGNAYGTVTVENCNIKELKIKTNKGGYSGGIVGWSTGQVNIYNSTITNCNIGGVDSNIANKANGGLVGFTYGSIYGEDITISHNVINNIQGTYDKPTYAGTIVGRLSGGNVEITNSTIVDNTTTDGSQLDIYTSPNSSGTVNVN